MPLFKAKIKTPDPSRFDRLDSETLFVLVEQAYSMAGEYLRQATSASDETVIMHLHNCDTALSDAQAGVRSMLRRKLAIAEGL